MYNPASMTSKHFKKEVALSHFRFLLFHGSAVERGLSALAPSPKIKIIPLPLQILHIRSLHSRIPCSGDIFSRMRVSNEVYYLKSPLRSQPKMVSWRPIHSICLHCSFSNMTLRSNAFIDQQISKTFALSRSMNCQFSSSVEWLSFREPPDYHPPVLVALRFVIRTEDRCETQPRVTGLHGNVLVT